MSSTDKYERSAWSWTRTRVARWAIVVTSPFVAVGLGVLVAWDLRPETTSFVIFPVIFIGGGTINKIIEQSIGGHMSIARWDADDEAKRVQTESYATAYWIAFWALALIVVGSIALYVRNIVTLQEAAAGGIATGAVTLMLLPSVIHCARLALKRAE